jgi:hypothetical protein
MVISASATAEGMVTPGVRICGAGSWCGDAELGHRELFEQLDWQHLTIAVAVLSAGPPTVSTTAVAVRASSTPRWFEVGEVRPGPGKGGQDGRSAGG